MIDIFPTLLELAGFDKPEKIQGESLVPLLTDPNYNRKMPAITEYYRGNVAIRDDRYRYILYANGEEELYDHKNDPNEWHNIAKESKLAEIKGGLREWVPKNFAAEGKGNKH